MGGPPAICAPYNRTSTTGQIQLVSKPSNCMFLVLYPLSCCSRMEETTLPEQAKSVLVLSLVTLLLNEGECGELLVSSSSPPVQWMEEGDELVRGTVLTGRESSPTPTVPTWSEGGEEQREGRGRTWQHDLPFKVEDSICSDPPMEVDTEVS